MSGTISTEAVRDLLTAITDVIDIPRPASCAPPEREAFTDAQRDRAVAGTAGIRGAITGGCTENALGIAAGYLRDVAAEPLPYVPREAELSEVGGHQAAPEAGA
jgi:hypothetical protein